jgi:hypothetical protein
VPDGGDDLFSVYGPVPVSDEIDEGVEGARGEDDLFLPFAELPAGGVERELTESDGRGGCLSSLRVSYR